MFKRNLVAVGALGLLGAVHGSKTYATTTCKFCEGTHARSNCASGKQCYSGTCQTEIADGSDGSSGPCAGATSVADPAATPTNACTAASKIANNATCKPTSTAATCATNLSECVGAANSEKCKAITKDPIADNAALPAQTFPAQAVVKTAGSSSTPTDVSHCASGSYAGAGADANACKPLAASAANGEKCIRTVTPGATVDAEPTVSDNCVSTDFCDVTAGSHGGTHVTEFATATAPVTEVTAGVWTNTLKTAGNCATKVLANATLAAGKQVAAKVGVHAASRTYGCAAGKKLDGNNKCQTPVTLAAAITAVEGLTKCTEAITALADLSGHGLATTWKTAKPSLQTNCYQVAEVDVYGGGKAAGLFWASTGATHKGASASTKPKCGLCSDECVNSLLYVKAQCITADGHAKPLHHDVLPFLKHIDDAVAAVSADVEGTKDPCVKTTSYMKGCSTTAGAYKDAWTASDKTGTAVTAAADITAFKTACAVVYNTDAATAKFAGATILASAVVIFSIFA